MVKVIEMIYDGVMTIIFGGLIMAGGYLGASEFYNMVKRAAVTQVDQGLSSTYRYTKQLTQKTYSWEK